MIPRKIHFIWFGGLPSSENWATIIDTKKAQPTLDVRLYVASSILDQDTLLSIKKICSESNVTLIDVDDPLSICRDWFGRNLLDDLLKIGFAKKAKHMYACASDLLRVMLMVYEGGFYFDCDCRYIPELNDAILNPKYGFLQLPYDYIRARNLFSDPPPIFTFAMQASSSFHPIYILALGNVVAKFNNQERLLTCCSEAPSLIELATGQSVRVALQIAAAEFLPINKHWFRDNCGDIFLQQDLGEEVKRGIGFNRKWAEPTQAYKRIGLDPELTVLYKTLKNEKYNLCYTQILEILPEHLTSILGRNNAVANNNPEAYLINPSKEPIDISTPSSTMMNMTLK